MLIPSSSDWATPIPSGSSPVLDHLSSTESMEVEYGDMSLGRAGKVAWLAEHRLELLPLLKVCYPREPAGQLRAVPEVHAGHRVPRRRGALEQATGFPGTIELDRFCAIPPTLLDSRLFWIDAVEALEASGAHPRPGAGDPRGPAPNRPSGAARARSCSDSARPWPAPATGPGRLPSPILFKGDFTDAALAVLRTGGPPRRRDALELGK